jgi:PIN domain nuclease of toxin-antitoxin system
MMLLDTHFWIWWLTQRSPLNASERNALDAAAEAGGVYLAAISSWEAQLLHSKQRLQLPVAFSDWLTRATESRVLTVLPLDREVVIAVDGLPTRFHGIQPIGSSWQPPVCMVCLWPRVSRDSAVSQGETVVAVRRLARLPSIFGT